MAHNDSDDQICERSSTDKFNQKINDWEIFASNDQNEQKFERLIRIFLAIKVNQTHQKRVVHNDVANRVFDEKQGDLISLTKLNK